MALVGVTDISDMFSNQGYGARSAAADAGRAIRIRASNLNTSNFIAAIMAILAPHRSLRP
jgi:hypothetical protein